MSEPFASTEPQQPEPASRLPMIIGAVVVLVALSAIVMFVRPSRVRVQPNEHARDLALASVTMSEAQNMVGGTSTYIEGTVTNSGRQVIEGATVQVTFRNSLGEVVQQETIPLTVILAKDPAVDVGRLRMAPLRPGATREFRLTFEHVSADWNRQTPEVKVISANPQ